MSCFSRVNRGRASWRWRRFLVVAAGALLAWCCPAQAPAAAGERPALKALVGHNWAPYQYVDDKGEPSGFGVALLRAVAEAADLHINIGTGPWPDVLREFEAGRVDVIGGMSMSTQRAQAFAFSTPIAEVSFGLFVRRDSPIRRLSDVKGREVLIQEGGVMREVLADRGITTNVFTVLDVPDALRLLQAGKHDCALVPRVQGLYLIDRFKYHDLRLVEEEFYSYKLAFAMAKSNPDLLYKLNEGLAVVKANGRYATIYDQWLGVYEQPGYGPVARWSLAALITILAVLALVLTWTWSLRRQVRARTAELRQVLDLVPHMIYAKDREGRFLLANQATAQAYGMTPEQLVGCCQRDVHPVPAELEQFLADDLEVIGQARPKFIPEQPFTGRDGTTRILQSTKIPFATSRTRQPATLGVSVDITAQQQAADAWHENEQRFRNMFEYSSVGLWELNLHRLHDRLDQWRASGVTDYQAFFRDHPSAAFDCASLVDLIAVNRVALELFQAGSAEEIAGAFPVIFCRASAVLIGELGCLAEGRRDCHGETIIKNLRGEWRHVMVQWRVPPGHEQALDCALVSFTDITALKRAEDALRASEENLAITLDSIGDAVIATGPGGQVQRMNRVAEELTGWPATEAQGRPLAEVFPIVNEATREAITSPVETVLREGRKVGLANRTLLRARDGTERVIADSGAPILDREGHIVGVVLVFRDVTRARQLEEQFRQAQKMESVGRLAGGVAHDFNNLLTGIMGYAELVKGLPPGHAKTPEYAGRILEVGERARELVSRLLAFSRRSPRRTRPVDLHKVIQEVAGLLEHTLQRRVEVKVQLPPEDAFVIGDPAQLHSALLNLAVNARDAMPQGGVLTFATSAITIEDAPAAPLATRAPGRYLVIHVKDTGVGMPASVRAHLFEPFFTTKRPGEGTGLGLSVVYGIVKDHGGFIEVDSEEGHGTEFRLFLPVSPLARIMEGAKARPQLFVGGGTILLVDDEPDILLTTGQLLSAMGYRVLTAPDGDQALLLYRNQSREIDLVILDLNMPGRPGTEVFTQLREIRADVKIVLSSGFGGDTSAEEYVAQGAAAFLQKPYRRDDLAEVIGRILSAAVAPPSPPPAPAEGPPGTGG